MQINELIQIMKNNHHLRTDEEVVLFENALAELPENVLNNKPDLENLFSVFDDYCEQKEVMWGLLHFVEDAEDEIFVGTLVEYTSKMVVKAKDWTEIFYCRVLNNATTQKILRDIINSRKSLAQDSSREVLEEIARTEKSEIAEKAKTVLS